METVYSAAESRDDVRLQIVLVTTPIDARNTAGHTALMFAADKGEVAAVNALMDKGANANAQSNNGNTALMFASKRGRVAIIEALLKRGADCMAKNNNGDWALTFAVAEGRVAVAEYLLNNGGAEIINTRNNSGETALMMACKNGALSCIELLYNKNASDKIVNNEGLTAHDLCKDKITLDHLQFVISAFNSKKVAEEIVRCRIRNDKLLKYIQESISNVRSKYLSDFKGKLLTLKNSKEEMEACIRLEQIERYELVPLLKSLCAHLARRTSYSTLDKRLLCALANPYSSQAEAAKPLLDRLINDGTIFPSEPAKRGDIHVYRSVYINSFSNIVIEVERSVAVSPAERNPVI